MNYHRCKCGKQEYWESGMSPRSCQGCDECGTTVATYSGGHRPVEPHDWVEEWAIRNKEPVKIKICSRCYEEEGKK